MTRTIKWRQELSESPSLPGENEIHLWHTDLDEPPANVELSSDVLSPSERERARRFVFEEHRRRYLASRLWLRSVLGSYLNLEPQDVPLRAGARGKPHLAAEANVGELKFSLSHCGRWAVLAVVAGCEIGVDLQDTPPDDSWAAIAERFFTPAEKEYLHTLSPAARASAFAEIWTRKEAAGKASGEGLTSRIFGIAVGPADWGTVDCGGGLLVCSLAAPARFAAAVAVRTDLIEVLRISLSRLHLQSGG